MRKPGDTFAYGFNVTEVAAELPWIVTRDDESNTSDGTSSLVTRQPLSKTNVKSITTAKASTGQTLDVDFPAAWFESYLNLKSFDGRGMDVPDATSLARLWYNDQNLEELVLVATGASTGWHTPKVTDVSELLYNVNALETLDGTGLYLWDVSKVTNVTRAFAEMDALTEINLRTYPLATIAATDATKLADVIAGDIALEWIYVNDTSVLDGSGLRSISTRTPTDGMWVRQGSTPIEWFGNGGNLETLYASGHASYGVQAYKWDSTRRGGRWGSNPHVWWMLTREDI